MLLGTIMLNLLGLGKDKRYYEKVLSFQSVTTISNVFGYFWSFLNSSCPSRDWRSHKSRWYVPSAYVNSNAFFDSTAHIRWTSSNFLHSSSWFTHRDILIFFFFSSIFRLLGLISLVFISFSLFSLVRTPGSWVIFVSFCFPPEWSRPRVTWLFSFICTTIRALYKFLCSLYWRFFYSEV